MVDRRRLSIRASRRRSRSPRTRLPKRARHEGQHCSSREEQLALKFDAERDPATNKRVTKLVTIRGTRKQAEAEFARLLANYDAGTLVEPSKTTVAIYMRGWIETAATLRLSPKTAERYRQIMAVIGWSANLALVLVQRG